MAGVGCYSEQRGLQSFQQLRTVGRFVGLRTGPGVHDVHAEVGRQPRVLVAPLSSTLRPHHSAY